MVRRGCEAPETAPGSRLVAQANAKAAPATAAEKAAQAQAALVQAAKVEAAKAAAAAETAMRRHIDEIEEIVLNRL